MINTTGNIEAGIQYFSQSHPQSEIRKSVNSGVSNEQSSLTPVHESESVNNHATQNADQQNLPAKDTDQKDSSDVDKRSESKKQDIDGEEISDDERAQLAELKQIDREVRSHEQAHLSAAGGLARGGANFTYTTGPDGRRYAVGGEVSIDTSAVSGNPQATILKAQQIRRAALAPAEPSGQDLNVASQATAMEQEARAEVAVTGPGAIESDANANQAGNTNSDKSTDTNNISASNDSVEKTSLQKNQGDAVCELCGGQHSQEVHVASNQRQIDSTYKNLLLNEQNSNIGKNVNSFA